MAELVAVAGNTLKEYSMAAINAIKRTMLGTIMGHNGCLVVLEHDDDGGNNDMHTNQGMV
eukprot:scaffold75470_cov51-Attheya_sp.AAC.3